MVKDDFEFNYKKEKKKKIVLSDVHIEIIIKVVFFTLLVMGLVGIGVFFPIYINIYCWVIGILFFLSFILNIFADPFGTVSGSVLNAFLAVGIIALVVAISYIATTTFMYHNLRNGGKEFIQNIDRSGNYSISIDSRDDKNKRKKFVINNKEFVITPVVGDKEFFIKKDGKYVLYLNNNHVNQIKDVNIKQQEDIKLDEINRSSKLNNDNDYFFYLLLAVSIGIFILFGICKG